MKSLKMIMAAFGLVAITAQSAFCIEITSFVGEVTRKGVVTYTARFSGTDSSCTVIIRGDKSEANAADGAALTSMSVISPALTWQRKVKRKTKGKTYIAAEVVCPDSIFESDPIQLKTNRIKSKKKRMSPKKWLQKLANALKS